MSYVIPSNVAEQTSLLVEAGIAARSMSGLHNNVEGVGHISVEMCQFWAVYTTSYEGGLQTPVPHFAVVILYPNSDPRFPHLVYGVAVTLDGSRGVALTPDEYALVESLAS